LISIPLILVNLCDTTTTTTATKKKAGGKGKRLTEGVPVKKKRKKKKKMMMMKKSVLGEERDPLKMNVLKKGMMKERSVENDVRKGDPTKEKRKKKIVIEVTNEKMMTRKNIVAAGKGMVKGGKREETRGRRKPDQKGLCLRSL
jgi:hypothetical protein